MAHQPYIPPKNAISFRRCPTNSPSNSPSKT